MLIGLTNQSGIDQLYLRNYTYLPKCFVKVNFKTCLWQGLLINKIIWQIPFYTKSMSAFLYYKCCWKMDCYQYISKLNFLWHSAHFEGFHQSVSFSAGLIWPFKYSLGIILWTHQSFLGFDLSSFFFLAKHEHHTTGYWVKYPHYL